MGDRRTVKKWNELDPSWPDAEIKLFGPGTDSGTFDTFTEVICGKVGNSRTDYQPSEDDNFPGQGLPATKNALGYFGYAYFVENKEKVKSVAVARGSDPAAAGRADRRQHQRQVHAPLPLALPVHQQEGPGERSRRLPAVLLLRCGPEARFGSRLRPDAEGRTRRRRERRSKRPSKAAGN